MTTAIEILVLGGVAIIAVCVLTGVAAMVLYPARIPDDEWEPEPLLTREQQLRKGGE